MDIPPKTAPRIFLIDAYALIYRAYFAFINRPLSNAAGENTSAPFGFTRFLLDIREDFEPDYLAVVFDAGTSFRDEAYPEYKATREKMPDDLRDSLGRIREIVEAFNDAVIELDGYEADDVIGTLALQARDAGLEAVIVSGDKDFYQLVQPGVHLLNPGRGGANGVAAEWVTEENAVEKFGIPPSRVIDYLALVGDSSDNVPGARGIGPKTAVSLIEEYADIESLLEDAENVQPARAAKPLREHADDVRISERLVTIMTDLPIDLDLEQLRLGVPDNEKLRDLFLELEFRRLTDQFATAARGEGEEDGVAGATVVYRIVKDPGEVDRLVERLRAEERVAVVAQASKASILRGELVGIAFAVSGGEAWYLPFGHGRPLELSLEGEDGDEGNGVPGNLPALDSEALAPLRAYLEDDDAPKVGHDLKATALALSLGGVTLRGMAFDVMVASYVLDPGRRGHELGTLSMEELGHKPQSLADVVGSGRDRIAVPEAPPAGMRDYLGEAATVALTLTERLRDRLAEHALADLMVELEMPLVPVLTRMERIGIGIDEAFFEEMRGRLKRELELIGEEIYKIAGGDFNLNSTPQLREVLFEKLELPVLKKTKTGPSTDASVLEELAAMGHDVPRLMIEYRELEKLRSTYVDALPQLVNSRTGRLHTSFNQTVAATGRLSSSEPNLQNIPIRTDLGREIRKGFVAAPGTLFLGVDYSQIELRVLAHFSGDEAFVRAFRDGVDVHRQTAAVIFDVDVADVTADMRARAKTVNFATLYGQGPFSLAKRLGITREEAKEFIDTYFERFEGVRTFLDAQVESAKEHGYVETLLGRRRYVPELESGNWNLRQFGERVAQNTPIQGTAADLMKKAMIEVQAALDEADTSAAILLQVHDELLLEVPEAEVEAARKLVVSRMEAALELNVPLVAEWGVGPNWYECKG
ncbi:MAG: DNA polymerase I [Gemmatimonadota bacterium]|nr:DNA polymerase I [Gemmatimonadota bacterium]